MPAKGPKPEPISMPYSSSRRRRTGASSTPLPDEKEDFVKLVWSTIANGTTPLECETAVKTDGYRVRRLLAHWVEEGALKARADRATA